MGYEEALFSTMEAREDKRTSIKDIITLIFSKKDLDQQTILSNENINAIIKMQTTNAYLKEHYGFEITLYKQLINDKRVNIISYQGRGRKDIIDSVKAMQENNIIEDKKGIL